MITKLKAQARTLRQFLEGHHFTLGVRHSLEVLAAMHGLPDWNTLHARPSTPLLGKQEASKAARKRLRDCGLHTSQELCQAMYQQVFVTSALLGPPSRGKVTILKTLILNFPNVLVIDTSAEICGEGTRHPAAHRVT